MLCAWLSRALYWDGAQWFLAGTPEPAGTASGASNELSAVRCVSRADCWAVGAAAIPGGQRFGQILHWDGSMWTAR